MNEKLFREAVESGRVAIDVARLGPDGAALSGETFEMSDLGSRFIRPKGGIRYDLEAVPMGGELLLRGSLSAVFEAECARCNRRFDLVVEVPEYAESFEIAEAEEWIDVTDSLREEILLEIPNFPVHDEDCKGLCPKCGADLNDGPCGCPRDGGDGRWSVLDALSSK